jgi:hypothetical protein
MRRLAVLALVLSGSSYGQLLNTPLSQADEQALRQAAFDVRNAIVRQDTRSILERISKSEGLACTDRRIPYQQVGKDLRDKNSHLYISLFDSERFSKRCGKEYPADFLAISDHEFFQSATPATVELQPLEHGLVQVVLKSHVKDHYPREWIFQKEQGQWRLINGFIVSRCSCG